MRLQKKMQKGAPYYVLGPLVTDVALGYDHINAAIGATAAAVAGVDFLCELTPSEHYSLPTLEDIRQGVIAYKIAAHAADVVKKPLAMKRDNEMSRARFRLDWKTQEKLAITGFKLPSNLHDSAPCSMCLSLCPMNIVGKMQKKNEKKPGNARAGANL
jgi:phosphomethylpyrimidine synthase